MNQSDNHFRQPWKSLLTANSGFEMTLKKTGNDVYDYCKKGAFLLHPSDQLINNEVHGVFTTLNFGVSLQILITPEVTRSNEKLRSLDPIKRQCFFENEGGLKYFRNYTRKNCEMECASDITYKYCGCVPFNYIRNKTMEVCDISSWICALNFRHLLHDEKGQKEEGCNCLPSCNSIFYHYEVHHQRIQQNFSEKYILNLTDFEILEYFVFSSQDYVTVSFTFKDNTFVPMIRYERFGMKDYFCYIGGLLGLFAGISVLSIIEIFYFFAVRAVSDFLRRYESNTIDFNYNFPHLCFTISFHFHSTGFQIIFR